LTALRGIFNQPISIAPKKGSSGDLADSLDQRPLAAEGLGEGHEVHDAEGAIVAPVFIHENAPF
jgi:hypothetical protein